AEHHAGWRIERAARRIFVGVARPQPRLFADDAGSGHFIDKPVLVGDVPIAGHQPDRDGGMVRDDDAITPYITIVIRIGLLLQIKGFDNNFDISCKGAIHAWHLGTSPTHILYGPCSVKERIGEKPVHGLSYSDFPMLGLILRVNTDTKLRRS